MSNLLQAARDIKVIAARLRPIMDVAETLEKIGSLDAAAREAQQRKDAAYDQEKTAKASLAQAEQHLLVCKGQIDQARIQAAKTLSDATAEANGVREQARVEAEAITNAARASKEAVRRDIENLKATLSSTQHQVDAKQRELSAITEQISKTKARIAALVE